MFALALAGARAATGDVDGPARADVAAIHAPSEISADSAIRPFDPPGRVPRDPTSTRTDAVAARATAERTTGSSPVPAGNADAWHETFREPPSARAEHAVEAVDASRLWRPASKLFAADHELAGGLVDAKAHCRSHRRHPRVEVLPGSDARRSPCEVDPDDESSLASMQVGGMHVSLGADRTLTATWGW